MVALLGEDQSNEGSLYAFLGYGACGIGLLYSTISCCMLLSSTNDYTVLVHFVSLDLFFFYFYESVLFFNYTRFVFCKFAEF